LRNVLLSGGAIQFPGLELGLEQLPKGIEFFGVTVSFSGMLIAVSLLLGLVIVECLAKKTKQNTETYLELAIRVVVSGVIGARILYVIFHWGYFKMQPAEMFSLRQGGMSFMGALISGLLVSYAYCRQRKISWLKSCDTALLGVMFGQILGKVGDFFGRTNLGNFSDGEFAMLVETSDISSQTMVYARDSRMMIGGYLQMHPVFLYELCGLLLLYFLIAVIYTKEKVYGIVLGVYLIGYPLLNFLLEFVRLDVARIAGWFSWEQFFSITTLIFGCYVLFNCYQRQHQELKNLPKNFFTEEE